MHHEAFSHVTMLQGDPKQLQPEKPALPRLQSQEPNEFFLKNIIINYCVYAYCLSVAYIQRLEDNSVEPALSLYL